MPEIVGILGIRAGEVQTLPHCFTPFAFREFIQFITSIFPLMTFWKIPSFLGVNLGSQLSVIVPFIFSVHAQRMIAVKSLRSKRMNGVSHSNWFNLPCHIIFLIKSAAGSATVFLLNQRVEK